MRRGEQERDSEGIVGGTEVSRQGRVMAGVYLSRRQQGSGETTRGICPNPLIKKAREVRQPVEEWTGRFKSSHKEADKAYRYAPNNSSATDDCSHASEKQGHSQFIPLGPVSLETSI